MQAPRVSEVRPACRTIQESRAVRQLCRASLDAIDINRSQDSKSPPPCAVPACSRPAKNGRPNPPWAKGKIRPATQAPSGTGIGHKPSLHWQAGRVWARLRLEFHSSSFTRTSFISIIFVITVACQLPAIPALARQHSVDLAVLDVLEKPVPSDSELRKAGHVACLEWEVGQCPNGLRY